MDALSPRPQEAPMPAINKLMVARSIQWLCAQLQPTFHWVLPLVEFRSGPTSSALSNRWPMKSLFHIWLWPFFVCLFDCLFYHFFFVSFFFKIPNRCNRCQQLLSVTRCHWLIYGMNNSVALKSFHFIRIRCVDMITMLMLTPVLIFFFFFVFFVVLLLVFYLVVTVPVSNLLFSSKWDFVTAGGNKPLATVD